MHLQYRRARVFDVVIRCVLVLLSFLLLYPFIYCLSYSFSNSREAMITNVVLLPVAPTLENFSYVFANNAIVHSFVISVLRTVSGILWALLVTGLAAYAISKKTLPFKRTLSIFFVIPMYISGGLLPTYVWIHDLHLFNNFLVYILPHGFWAFNMLLMRSYFDTIPESLEEASRIDGAKDLRILVQVVVPLSMPIIAVIAVYVGVWHWNEWFEALLYITHPWLKPMQSMLQRIIMESMGSAMEAQSGRVTEHEVSPTSIQMATLIVSTVPIILIYPFVQRYFIQGVMIGAVKA
ncbi:MAG TPA: carbohydrate ABC transporter permease [Spirochaetia bacterium]|nr:carbohydrate ABC transporter permease [Spirochaetia bacterium]